MIYNDPNHPLYGPARRLHLMLLQLTADKPDFAELEARYEHNVGKSWTSTLQWWMDNGKSEPEAQRQTLRNFITYTL